ncbi:DUF1439 domain-containing protein [Vibrio rarus]|uniref:DUF1439 domain-containing protein n=1 Tax=Vibrio rarus TaxID=413403 RepID=UPI0021C4221A|nr:DUF1439 domain-containing protein [Vibrio rarus]
MNKKFGQRVGIAVLLSLLSGCTVYRISEQDMTQYVHKNVGFSHSVGMKHVMYAHLSVDDLKVKIGRVDAERISIYAATQAKVQVLDSAAQTLHLQLEFSAIPEYEPMRGEVFLKKIRLETFTHEGTRIDPDIERLIKPAVAMIGYGLSDRPVYQLDSNALQQALIKSAQPDLRIKDHKLVIELFD